MFKSKKEFAKAMIDGRRFVDDDGARYYAEWIDGSLRFRYAHEDVGVEELKACWKMFDSVLEEPVWYPEPNEPVYVWDNDVRVKHPPIYYASEDYGAFFDSSNNPTLFRWEHYAPLPGYPYKNQVPAGFVEGSCEGKKQCQR